MPEGFVFELWGLGVRVGDDVCTMCLSLEGLEGEVWLGLGLGLGLRGEGLAGWERRFRDGFRVVVLVVYLKIWRDWWLFLGIDGEDAGGQVGG